ncbi:anti-sigma-D factor RsdA [Mycobacterium spongiae]|uniref:Anti-sigma-D factor RsdA sigma factor binding region domain-containing protein n=1 Tax=Mycobacterium spongiae TaxID=886343 RepID=A0A975PYR6_9MYCO|nr:anti-sigma-D factor RsdA [Mycobacterium spongiae]QUR69596.1 hypothetical protein F6B93_04825 [Mycobacterium spongiae]
MRNSGSDSGYPLGSLGDQPALDELAHTDLLLDALAEREDVGFGDPDDLHDQALAELLSEWRDDLRWPPASALVSQDEAVEALITGVTERRRTRRGLAAMGSVAATLLLLSGFGAVVADARPGDLLYGLHAMIFDDSHVNDDQIVLSAKAELAKVEQMIAEGQWDQAETQLAEVSSTVQAVNDGGRRQDLIDEVNQLNTKVEQRDPNATLPEGSLPQSELPDVLAPSDSPGDSLTPPAGETASPAPASPPLQSDIPPSSAPEWSAPSPPSEAPPSAQITAPTPAVEAPAVEPTSPPAATPTRGPRPGPDPASATDSSLEPAAGGSISRPSPEAHLSGQDASDTPATASPIPEAGVQ